MVVLQETEQDSLLLTRNLLRIAIYNISYIRGLFHEKYFTDKSVPALEMKIKNLIPMDEESRRLINCMEKGVYDALQKKYLKTLVFSICEKEEGAVIEEYSFSFDYPNNSTMEIEMTMSCAGCIKGGFKFTTNASEVTPDQMRSSACSMIKTLVSLMRTLDPMPEERTILMKLLYYDDVTPEDYEPPLLKSSAESEGVNIWNKNPLKMEVGSINRKHLVLALKVKNALPCDDNSVNSGDEGMSLDNSEPDHDGGFSVTENGSTKNGDRGSFGKMESHAANILKAKYGQNWDGVYADDNEPLKYIAEMFPNDSSALFDADGRMYHSEDYNFEKEEYPGISPIYNSVTVSLDGPKDAIAYRVKMAAGHIRLYNAFYGNVLDVSSFVGYPKLIYTTARKGTFYSNFTCTEYDPLKDDVIRHWVRLVIDCREGWCYGFVNQHGHFEFMHEYPIPYIKRLDRKMLDFSADYSNKGIAPDGHGSIRMGYLPMRRSVQTLSEYNGRGLSSDSDEVRSSCSVLINGSCETYKFHAPLFWLSVAIREGLTWSLDDCDPILTQTLRNWSDIGEHKLQVFLQLLAQPVYPTEINLPNIPGLLETEDAFDTVAIVPHNRVPRFGDKKNARKDGWTLMEAHGDALIGRPHEWSHYFLGPAPYIAEMERVRPSHRIIDGTAIGELTKKKQRIKPGTAADYVKKSVCATHPHLLLARKALNALRRIK